MVNKAGTNKSILTKLTYSVNYVQLFIKVWIAGCNLLPFK